VKHTKNIVISILAITALYSKPMQTAVPAVEIYNKSNSDIEVRIENMNDGIFLISGRLSPKDTWKPNIDINTKLRFRILTLEEKPSICSFTIDAPGKTKYLSWNPGSGKGSFYPQTGPLMGLMGKTQSGLSLKKNITSSQIKLEVCKFLHFKEDMDRLMRNFTKTPWNF
jgi:hypothetical protein